MTSRLVSPLLSALWFGLALTARAEPTLAPGDEIRQLAARLANGVAAGFPVISGAVIDVDGRVVEVAFAGEVRIWIPNVEFYRSNAGSSRNLRRIGLGRILTVEGGRARVEVTSSEGPVGVGDQVRSGLGELGIGVLVSPDGDPRAPLTELLAVRVAHELDSLGRFHAVVLEPERTAESEPSVAAAQSYLWRGLLYTLNLSYIEEGASGTLIGRLFSLRENRTVDVLSARVLLGDGWPTVFATLAASGAQQTGSVEHAETELGYEVVALQLFELHEQIAVAALSRTAVHILAPQAEAYREERTISLPAEYISGRRSRDYLGALAVDRDGRLRLGHTLLSQELSVDLTGNKLEPVGTMLWLGEQTAPLMATYRRGDNRLETLLLGGAAFAPSLSRPRFAGWIGPGQVLVQDADYRLVTVDTSSGRQNEISRAVGGAVSVMASPTPLIATTSPSVADSWQGTQDQVVLLRVRAGQVDPLWKSNPTEGPIRATSLATLRGRLILAAVEARGSGSRLHVYSNLPMP